MKAFLNEIWRTRDWTSLGLLSGIAIAALWVSLLPVSHWVQDRYFDRFQLQTTNYPAWAAQQLTPAMYNLENTYWFSPEVLSPEQRQEISRDYFVGLRGREDTSIPPEVPARVHLDMINHFPTRTMTFVQSRAYLKQQREGYFYFRTRYRGRQQDSVYQIRPVSEHQSEVIRVKVGHE